MASKVILDAEAALSQALSVLIVNKNRHLPKDGYMFCPLHNYVRGHKDNPPTLN